MWFLLQTEIQTASHDSIEDAKYALMLYRAYLGFEEDGRFEEMMEQSGDADATAEAMEGLGVQDEDIPVEKNDRLLGKEIEEQFAVGAIRTLDGEIAGDEFAQDAMNYQILLGKIDQLLENLNLDA